MEQAQRCTWVRGPGRRPSAAQRGQVVPLVAVLLVLAGLLGAGLAHLGAVASRRAAVQAAADAAALAGAADGPPAARRVAAENGARLVSYEVVGADVVATVERGDVSASARARWEAQPPGADPDG